MSRVHLGIVVGTIGLALLAGCAQTVVKKDPGSWNKGIRYYRPKPYLLVQAPEAATDLNQVRIKLEYLPDFTEEYAINIRAGLGTNNTSVTLENGWNLTAISVDVDSQADELLTAFSGLVGNLPKETPGGSGGNNVRQDDSPGICVQAYDVPLGYYESILSEGPDGKKRLYGWRYVGFAPFLQCPTEMGGLKCESCDMADLYGLVTIDNKMYFRRLGDIACQPHSLKVSDGTVAAPAVTNPPPLPPGA